MKWALTGTPGTGKTTVAERLDGIRTVHLNELLDDPAFQAGFDDARQTIIADIEALSDWLDARADDLVVESHLSHLLPVDAVIVLRCHPDVLEDRLGARPDADSSKIEENLDAERLDLILAEAVERHDDRVYEVDTTERSPEAVVEVVTAILDGSERPQPGNVSYLVDP